MYILILLLPFINSVLIGLLGRKLGEKGIKLITYINMLLCSILSIIIFIEVAISNSNVYIKIFDLINSELLNINYNLYFDSLTVSILLLVIIVSTAVHIYSLEYMGIEENKERFISYLSLFTLGMLILIFSNNLFIIFFGWESIGLTSYLLVNYWYTRIYSNRSAMQAIFINRIGDYFYILSIFVIFNIFGTYDLITIFTLIPYINISILFYILLGLIIASVAKSAQLPLHSWLPSAMAGPTPVSSLIHAATMVTAGAYLLIRISPILEYSETSLLIITILGALTTFYGGILGIFQYDIKNIIAYSTLSQLGYLFISIGISNYSLTIFHLLNHGFFKGLLFLSAGALIHALNDEQDHRKMGGLVNILPFTYINILIGSLSLMALPYLSGFYSKDMIIELAYSQFHINGYIAYWSGSITALLTALYSIRLIILSILSYPKGHINNYIISHEPNKNMSYPLIILSLFSIFSGYLLNELFIGIGTNYLSEALYIHPNHIVESEYNINLVYKLIPLVGTIFIIIFSKKLITLLNKKYIASIFLYKLWFEYIQNIFILYPFLNFSYFSFKFIDKGLLEIIGPLGLINKFNFLSFILNKFTNGYIKDYAIYIIISLLICSLISLNIINISTIFLFSLFFLFNTKIN